ncbi:MAG: type II secretion system inner membrane protein GspF [Candidatus Theseobacter exili]|nr:type II secretion system inner membrane protein GspF [Candidatus Theseobacter exili]
MAKFAYTAMDSKGKEVSGTIDASDNMAAINKLREKGLYPTNVTEAGTKKFSGKAGTGAGQEKRSIWNLDIGGGKVGFKQLVVMSRQLATLIDAGLPLLRSLGVLIEGEKHLGLKKTISQLSQAVEGGSTFSEALAQFPKVFSKLFVNMVRAGEAGGVLDLVLNRLAEFFEKSQKLKNKIKAAMIYPILVLVFAMGILIFLITVIVPKFADMFYEMEIELPGMTEFLIKLSDFVKGRWYLFILAIVLIIFGSKAMARTEKGRYWMDFMKLKLPVFGTLVQRIAISRFSRTLGTLIASGVPILQALNIVRDTVGNEVIGVAVTNVHDSIREGESIVDPLRQNKVFPPLVISMIDVGEETGNLAEMLEKIADTYDDEVDNAVEGLTSLLEPLLIMTLAFIVGFIVIAMFLPLIKLMQSMG